MVTNQGARKGGQAMGKNRVGPSQRVFRFNCIHKAFPLSLYLSWAEFSTIREKKMQNSKSNNWVISEEMLTELPKMLVEIMRTGDTRSKVAAARALIAMVNFNLKLPQNSGGAKTNDEKPMTRENYVEWRAKMTRLIERDVDAKVEKKLGEIAEREAAAAAAKQAEMN